jgi:uncharacterized repeat protein (TIGR02543 family)
VANNQTQITIKGYITTDSDSYRGDHNTGSITVTQDGAVIYSGSFTSGAPYNSNNKELFSVSTTVDHYSDGTSGTIAASYNYSNSWCTASTSTTLTPIYRELTHKINHYFIGFNGEENTLPEYPNHYVLGSDSVTIAYEGSININDYVCQIPNGAYFSKMWDGINNYYSDGTYKQGTDSLEFNFYYYPYEYNITYNLDGGVNNTGNPSTYNILYGVSLQEPTRENYTFKGWHCEDVGIITGINEGKNAEFLSVDMMYSELDSRTIGDINLTATWIGNEYNVILDSNGGDTEIRVINVYYENAVNNNISMYKPIRKGYKFLGWFSSPDSGIQVYDGNGLCTNDGIYWLDNEWIYLNDIVLYAHWEIANCAYYKLNGEWVFCQSYVKVDGIWKPAIIKIKTDGDWNYQVFLTNEDGYILTDENGNHLYII